MVRKLPRRLPQCEPRWRVSDAEMDNAATVKDGDTCMVISGTHKGQSGVAHDSKTSKPGHVTITVRQKNGECFKTLARNVIALP